MSVVLLLSLNLCTAVKAQDTLTDTQDTTAKQDAPAEERISDIQIKGNSAISAATVLNKLKIKPGDVFDETALNKELKRLYATGYFADIFVETEKRQEGVVVVFTVVEKPIIDKIEFSGNTKIRAPRLEKKITIRKGDLLDYHVLSKDVEEIKKYYVDQGYSQVGVEHKVDTSKETGRATVTFVVNEGTERRIKTITFEGNKSIPSGELSKYMSTKTAWWFIRKGAYDDDKFKADLDRIKTLYRSKGFLDAEVSSKTEYSADGKFIYLIIVVNEGPLYKIGDITVQGNLVLNEKDIWKTIKIKKDKAFDYQKIKDDIDNIRSLYYDKGYMNAEIDLRHRYNSNTDRMDIVIAIEAHEIVYVGKVNVIGNTKTKDKIVRREIRLYPGDRYDGQKLKKSKERIYNLGFFEDVYFETVPTDEENVKNLNVTVKETKTGEFSFGGGYSSVDAFIGFVQIRQRNFDILNFPTFTGSGQDLILRAEAGTARTTYVISWTDPWIFDFPYLFGFDAYRTEHKKYGESGYDYDETRTGGSLRLGKDLTDEWHTGLIYNLERVDLSDIPDTASGDLKEEVGHNMISRVTWDLKYDTRDNIYSPTKGLITGLSLENAGGIIGGDKSFVKGYLHGSFYHSIIDQVVLELKGRGGMANSYGSSHKVPIYERFFAGGATTVRGYNERGIGPRDTVDPGIPVGGESTLIGNAEVMFPIFKQIIKGAVFYDVGTVHAKASDVFSGGDYKQGAGVGLRVKTPIGPIKLDYGYPLNDNHDDKRTGQFYFSVSHGF